MARRTKVVATTVCSPDFAVSTLSTTGGTSVFRPRPCEECPWRRDVPTGVFPAEAFRTSAHTAHDASMSKFACHMSGKDNPATCAGFLVRHGANNVGVRLVGRLGVRDLSKVTDGGLDLYDDYREMAVANGVDPHDDSLRHVRGENDEWDGGTRRWKPR